MNLPDTVDNVWEEGRGFDLFQIFKCVFHDLFCSTLTVNLFFFNLLLFFLNNRFSRLIKIKSNKEPIFRLNASIIIDITKRVWSLALSAFPRLVCLSPPVNGHPYVSVFTANQLGNKSCIAFLFRYARHTPTNY